MTTRAMHDHAQVSPSLWRATLSGLSGSLVGIGLARFSYTPLLPAIVAAGWFDPSNAAYLGAANLAGYLGGALLAAPLASRIKTAAVLNAMMLLATAAFFASAWPIDFAWFFVWRFASGLAGGVIMVLAASSILPHTAPARRGLVSGAIFMGGGNRNFRQVGRVGEFTLAPHAADEMVDHNPVNPGGEICSRNEAIFRDQNLGRDILRQIVRRGPIPR